MEYIQFLIAKFADELVMIFSFLAVVIISIIFESVFKKKKYDK